MFNYARTKEFIVSTQPGDRSTESIPIKGATRIVMTRHNTNDSFCSSSSLVVYPLVSYDGVTFRSAYINCGNGTSINRQYYHGTDQNTTVYDYDMSLYCNGFNYMKLYNNSSTMTATAFFKVMVIS